MTVIQTVMGDCQFILVFFRLLLLWIQLWSLPVAEILFSNVLLQCAAVESANLCIFGCATISAGSCQFTSACSWIWWVAFVCCMTDVFRVRLWARIWNMAGNLVVYVEIYLYRKDKCILWIIWQSSLIWFVILAEGAVALPVTLSGGALFASWKLLQFPSSLIVKVILAIFMRASAQLCQDFVRGCYTTLWDWCKPRHTCSIYATTSKHACACSSIFTYAYTVLHVCLWAYTCI